MTPASRDDTSGQVAQPPEAVCFCPHDMAAMRRNIPESAGWLVCGQCHGVFHPYYTRIPAHDSALPAKVGGVGASTDVSVTSHAQRMDVERSHDEASEIQRD